MNKNGFLASEHPAYRAQKEVWLKNERRFLGGEHVAVELTPFDWEIANGPHHTERKANVTYLNWPDRFASLVVGHMMRQAPRPDDALDFGTLGQVRRLKDVDTPTRAELLYYNTDGVGNDGSQWDNFWTSVARHAVIFGHTWVLAEGPPERPLRFDGELRGLRPFLSEHSPLDVTNWGHERGMLSFAVLKRWVRRLRIGEKGELSGNDGELEYLLLTRAGFMDFGTEFGAGGWFTFDEEGNPLKNGTWSMTNGEIPMVPLFYERLKPSKQYPAISRSGVEDLGNLAVSYMNLASAADFDAWDGASSVQAILGATEDAFNLFIAKLKEGSRYAPLPSQEGATTNPDVKDASMGSVTADVFDRRLAAKRIEAVELMLNELHTAPYASGESKRVSWTDSKAPRLAVLAAEVESSQNAMIHFMEQLWGFRRPSGATQWRREFDLIDVLDAAQEYFTIRQTAGVRSPTLDAKVMIAVAKSKGWITDNEEQEKVRQELESSGQAQQKIEDTPPAPPMSGGPSGSSGSSGTKKAA